MNNEAAYHFSFVYTVLLVSGALVWVCISRAFRKTRYGIGVAVGALAVFMAFDLYAFNAFSWPHFTLPREGLRFNESRSGVEFPDLREKRLYEKDQFRYFKPALYERFTAFDSSFVAHFDKESIRADIELFRQDIMNGNFPLQKEVIDMSIADMVEKTGPGYPGMSTAEKISFLGILELFLEEMGLKHAFFSALPGMLDDMVVSRRSIERGYAAISDTNIFFHPGIMIDSFSRLLGRRDAIKRHIENTGLDFYEQNFGISNFEARKERHAYLFYRPDADLTVADYIIRLSRLYRLDDPTFVRFRDYDDMVGIFDPGYFHEDLPAIRKKIIAACGIDRPLLRFYDRAEYMTENVFWEKLASGKLDPEILYVHGPDRLSKQNIPGDMSPAGIPLEPIGIVDYSPERIELSVFSPSGGYVYFSDGYDRYWKVHVEDEPAELLKANGLFKAVKVPPGSNKVVFSYDPVFFRLSLWIYYLVSAICLIYLFFSFFSASKK